MSRRIAESRKIAIVREYNKGASVKELCKKYHIAKSTFYTWVRPYTENRTKYGTVTPRDLEKANRRIRKLEDELEALQSSIAFRNMGIKDKEAEIDALYGNYSLHVLCDAFKLDRGSYYNHRFRAKGRDAWYEQRKQRLIPEIQKIFDESNQIYGAKKICAILRGEGERINEAYVSRIMKEMGISSIRASSKKISQKMATDTKRANKLQQRFDVTTPNQVWVTDMTSFNLKGRRMYICAYLDLYSRKVVAYRCGRTPSTNLATRTLSDAMSSEHPPRGLLLHSDNGGAFASYSMMRLTRRHHITQSFSRPGTPHDNAVIESFFESLKNEFIHRNNLKSEREFLRLLDEYMDFYNNRRIHSYLGYMTPAEAEANFAGYSVA